MQKEINYHNTTHLNGAELLKAVEQATIQKEMVLLIFKQFQKPKTPREIHRIYNQVSTRKNEIMLTSIRRSISVLTNAGLLVKTDKKKLNHYGRSEYMWQLNRKR